MRIEIGCAAALLLCGSVSAVNAQEAAATTAAQRAAESSATEQGSLNPLAAINTGPANANDPLPDAGSAPLGATSETGSKTSAIAQVSASNDSGQATMKISNVSRNGKASYNTETGLMTWKPVVTSWSIALSAPTNASTQAAAGTIATATLPASFQAKIAYSQFRGFVAEQQTNMATLNAKALTACEKQLMEKNHGANIATAKSQCEAQERQIGGPETFIKQYLPDAVPQFESYKSKSTGYLWGIDGAGGYNTLTYYNPATAAKSSETDPPWMAEGFFGYSPNKSALLLLGSFGYQTSYTAQTTGTLCPVSASAKILKCVTGALGAPTQAEAMPVSFEPRWQLGLGTPFDLFGITSAAFDPKMSYDIRKGIYGFNTQITFGQSASESSQDSSKTLTGGIQFGWQSNKHIFVAGLFVGAPFSLFSAP